MGIRERLARLEKALEGEVIEIPHGTVRWRVSRGKRDGTPSSTPWSGWGRARTPRPNTPCSSPSVTPTIRSGRRRSTRWTIRTAWTEPVPDLSE